MIETAPSFPTFAQANNRRQKARAAGMNPNYWYPVEMASRLRPGDLVEVKFWGKSYALFRGQDGVARCVENRCAHRQLKLTTGHVRDCHVVCPYHGWSYDGDGRLVDIPHDLFGHKWPKFSVGSFPVRERYGLVWMFPGDPERADKVAMPEIPEIEGPNAWACVPVDFVWNCHHSMVIDNVSDFTHAYLHRRFEPFKDAKLTNLRPDGDRVFVEYDTVIGGGKFYNRFIDTAAVNTGHIKLCYEYPHQWSNTGDAIKEWCLVLPIDERTTRTFFLFYYKQFKIPFTPLRVPQRMMKAVLRVANEVLMKPLLREDGVACEAEQDGYERHFDAPIAEFNPAVNAFQDLTIRKWQEHLDERDALPKTHRLPVAPRFGCAV